VRNGGARRQRGRKNAGFSGARFGRCAGTATRIQKKGLSFISNRHRRNEGTFSASEFAGIEPTPPAPKGAGYVRLDHSATVGIDHSDSEHYHLAVGNGQSRFSRHPPAGPPLMFGLETWSAMTTMERSLNIVIVMVIVTAIYCIDCHCIPFIVKSYIILIVIFRHCESANQSAIVYWMHYN
jgi:hypothetical protein